ncbi:MAG: DUF2180 family protein [Methanobacteriaceae archaeon]|nr:DUF2180 family protein [Methanobacteriaceae archaeon]
MKCYVCAKEGRDTEAIAICIVCGMGLCDEHIVREDIELWSGGYPFPSEKVKEKLPRILCRECFNALEAAEK